MMTPGPVRKYRLAAMMLWILAAGVVYAATDESKPTPAADGGGMTTFQAIVLGIVEGVTEYLPVSSTGHLIVTQRAMGITDDPSSRAYAICIQAGAIVAVLGLYFSRIRQMARGALNRDRAGQRLLFNVIVAFIPAAIVGLIFDEFIESHLYGMRPIISAWALGGAAILIVAWMGKEKFPPQGGDLEHLSRKRAIAIGLLQCIAMWPGVSRSLVTIVGGVLVGLSLPAAVEFSFLLGLLTLGAATVYKSMQHGPEMLTNYGAEALLAGFLAAFFSAIVAVKWMVAYLNKHSLAIFGYYRVALALAVAALIWLEYL